MRTVYRAGYKDSTLLLEESRQGSQWVEPHTREDGTRYNKPQEALEAFIRSGAGSKTQFQLKPITIK